MSGRLTNREMLSYGFKPGKAWGEQRRELERGFDRADRSDRAGMSSRSMSSGGLPSGSQTQALQLERYYSTGHGYARHSGYGSGHLQRADYASPGRTTYPQDPRMMQYREPSSRSVSSRASSPLPSYAPGTHGRSYSLGYVPSSSYTPSAYQSHSGSSRYSGYGYSGSGSSSYTPRSLYESDDEDYQHGDAPSSGAESEPHFASGYAETNFIIEPSDSGSEASYSGEHSSYGDSESERGDSGSGYSGSEGDSVYSEGADDEYDDFDDDGGSYSDDGGYYSDD
ncbi:hypothetical protein B0H17DRAFT_1330234 [Mycena rosella]|uniref:Uncharacterized protein n=1 Tax=Mycena rosella TaxID=1033263 RepID=A0AAD7DKL6_MYCRO|nr:hypothetical protein B0H17DRAFT_1330234 [Mycena rosella]